VVVPLCASDYASDGVILVGDDFRHTGFQIFSEALHLSSEGGLGNKNDDAWVQSTSSADLAEWARRYENLASGEVIMPDNFILRGTPDKEDIFYLNRMNLTFKGYAREAVRTMRHFALLARTDSAASPLDPRYELKLTPYPVVSGRTLHSASTGHNSRSI
jgi:hypothetical protein